MKWEAFVDRLLAFASSHLVSLGFTALFISIVGYVVMLNFSKHYAQFRIAHLVMRADGTLDRKAFKDTLLFFVSMYGFVFVMHRHPDLIITYFTSMAAIWLGAHAIDNKFPTRGRPPDIGPIEKLEEAK